MSFFQRAKIDHDTAHSRLPSKFVWDSLCSWEVERMLYNGVEGEGEGGGGSWEGEHLDTVNSIPQAALADKPHPKFGNLNFGEKKF